MQANLISFYRNIIQSWYRNGFVSREKWNWLQTDVIFCFMCCSPIFRWYISALHASLSFISFSFILGQLIKKALKINAFLISAAVGQYSLILTLGPTEPPHVIDYLMVIVHRHHPRRYDNPQFPILCVLYFRLEHVKSMIVVFYENKECLLPAQCTPLRWHQLRGRPRWVALGKLVRKPWGPIGRASDGQGSTLAWRVAQKQRKLSIFFTFTWQSSHRFEVCRQDCPVPRENSSTSNPSSPTEMSFI